jgi:hypothetical protein
MNVLVLAKFYHGFQLHYCYHILTQCLHHSHFHCQMRLIQQRQCPKCAPIQFLFCS